MVEQSPRDRKPLSKHDTALAALRERIEQVELDLRGIGFIPERIVTPPGVKLVHQRFDGDVLIFLLFGIVWIGVDDEERVRMGPGDRLRVASGHRYSVDVEGETTAYWIHAFRPDAVEPQRPAQPAST